MQILKKLKFIFKLLFCRHFVIVTVFKHKYDVGYYGGPTSDEKSTDKALNVILEIQNYVEEDAARPLLELLKEQKSQ